MPVAKFINFLPFVLFSIYNVVVDFYLVSVYNCVPFLSDTGTEAGASFKGEAGVYGLPKNL